MKRSKETPPKPDSFYVAGFGMWFCIVNGWVRTVEEVYRPVSAPVAEIIKEVQPGVTLVEASS